MNTNTSAMELSESISEGNVNNLEYVMLDKLCYTYLIEEFLMDINKFEYKHEEVNVKDDGKKKKDGKVKKEGKDGKDGNKVKKGNSTGNKKKNDKDDLALSKESSKLSIFSTKSAGKGIKVEGQGSGQTGQKLKVTIGGKNGKTMILDKNKIPPQIQKLINAQEKMEKINKLDKLEREENVVTTKKDEDEGGDEVKTDLSKKTKTKDKKKKAKEAKEEENVKKQPVKETAPVLSKEQTGQNKKVEDFLKSVKEKKGCVTGTKQDEKVSLKNIFLDKHKYLFTLDPTQRLRLRELAVISIEVIDDFFNLLNITYESFEKFAKEEDYIKTNTKDAAIIIDNLAEMCLNTNKEDLLEAVIDKALVFISAQIQLISSSKPQLRVIILNVLYTVYKYKNECNAVNISLERINLINKSLFESFGSYLNENYLDKNKEKEKAREKEHKEKEKSITNITVKNLKEDDEILFYTFSKSLITILITIQKDSKKIGSDLINVIIDENIQKLLNYMNREININEHEDYFEDFLIDYSNLRFFTKFSHLFDLNKSKLYVLSIKASRSIEAHLTDIQNVILKYNDRIFSFIINNILTRYIKNFPEFYELQESLYEDIFNLLKFICDEKVLSNFWIKEIFLDSKSGKVKIGLQDHMMYSDEMISKFITLLIKYIKYFERVFYKEDNTININSISTNSKEKEKVLVKNEEDVNIYLTYFHEVLSIVLNLKQGYIREKYFKIMERTIETHLDDKIIAEKIFSHITDVIRNGLMTNLNSNLLHSIKTLKDLIKFYSNYQQIKGFILKLFDVEIKYEIEFSLFSIFYLNFLNLNKQEDFALLHSLIINSHSFIENILFIDRKLCSYLTKYYINEEIGSLENIINIIFTDLSNDKDNRVSFDNLVNYLLTFAEKTLINNNKVNNKVNNINMILSIVDKFIAKGLFTLDKFVPFVNQFLNLLRKIEKKTLNVNSNDGVIINTIIVYLINKVSIMCETLESGSELKLELEQFNNITNNIKAEFVDISNVSNSSSLKLDLLKEITLINDNLKKPNPKEYFKSFDQIVFVVIELLQLNKVLKKDQNYFKVENIEIENVEIVKENSKGIDDALKQTDTEIVNGNGNVLNNKEKLISSVEKKDGTNLIENSISNITTIVNTSNTINTTSNTIKINFDVILHIFKNYLTHIDSFLKSNSNSNSNTNNLNTDIILFNLVNFQETINLIFANNTIFNNLICNKTLLEEFIKSYLSLKEKSFELGQRSLKELRKIDSESKQSSNSTFVLDHKEDIQRNLHINELSEKVVVYCNNFVKYRCINQIVFLFKEDEIYKMFLTKDREFHKQLHDRMDEVYKTTIINEENIKNLIAKAQNDEEDLLEEVVHSIFSKQVISYLECPEEIIEFLSSMNDALKYDLKVDRKEFYNSLFSYFYLWKTIMSKIENGFKLYTTDKQYVGTIDNYKTLLKFIISYLERNAKLYEMFLLLVVSLIHLIDDERSLDDKSLTGLFRLNDFDDSTLSDSFDTNTFQFLLSVLYKFVKIFPSMVKFYYDESKTKLKNVFKAINTSIILPNMLIDLKERINLNIGLLAKYKIRLKDTKSLNYIEFEFDANDEIRFVIDVKIPPIFPLKKLEINFKCNAQIDEKKLLNVKMNLNQTMNSSVDNVTDNLIIWSENVRQLVLAGQEPCPVCYSFLHTTDKSLPCSTCKTCKNKFHSLCMKEWFKSLAMNGQKYSCPMCRSEWKMH